MLRGSFEKAYDAMKKMVAYRDARGLKQPLLEWKYLLFNWNDQPAHHRAGDCPGEGRRDGHPLVLAHA